MQIVLPGALPDPAQARELAPHLSKAAPTLAGWLQRGRARVIPAPTAPAGCTAFEQWRLHAQGFTPEKNQNLSAGLGPLLLDGIDLPSTAPVWLGELVHVSPSRDGAALLPARDLSISAQHSVSLFASAQALFEDTGFSVYPYTDTHWRVAPPDGFSADFASPELVAITSVNDWWSQQEQTRPWRRLFNELQMSWFNHPVNLERERHGLPAINSLWLFGGACRQQFSSPGQTTAAVHADLYDYSMRQDWGGWIAALQHLENTVFSGLASAPPALIVLTGRERIVEVRPDTRWWRRFLKTTDSWSSWW